MAGSDRGASERFESLVAAALDELPAWVHAKLDNVDVVIEDRPPAEEPELLGLYQGIPLTERGMDYTWALPDRITLYRSTIEAEARGKPDAIRAVVADTVIHEIAHFFGISDERLDELERY